jgi:kumamolisin
LVADQHVAGTSYTPLQLAEIYGMPPADGSGQTIAIVELGGGFGHDDLDAYFDGLGLPSPSVTAVGVDGVDNEPGSDPDAADREVLLDIEVAGAIAPKANILVYFAPNTDDGFLDAVSTAAHAAPTPTAISISWGQNEDRWAAAARTAMDGAFADAAAMGVTVTAAAGDSGSGDGAASGQHADFPASSPHVLGCGGTSLQVADGGVASETVWNGAGPSGATGGGVSDAFGLPEWQQGAGVPRRAGGGIGRGVPDVAAVADPQTGYEVLIDGATTVIGGTSAVAPLWAGLIARIVQRSGAKVGLANTALYAGVSARTAAPHLRDITAGSNRAYVAGPGWDACTGLGVPDAATAAAFSTAAASSTGA